MYVLNDSQILVVATPKETFTFLKAKSGICEVSIERYNQPIKKLNLNAIINQYNQQLATKIEKFNNETFSFDIKSDTSNKYLSVKLQEGQLIVFPLNCEPIIEK